MAKLVDLSHIVFLDLLHNVVDTAGPKVAKGNLMRIALNASNHLEQTDYASFEEFIEACNSGNTPLARMEGAAVHLGGGVFGLKACPFGSLARNYKEFFEKDASGFEELTQEFNSGSKITREYRVGLGAGVGPFCIFHQPMRSQAQTKITIDGQPIEIFQLACKSSAGSEGYADALIEEFGCDKAVVEAAMKDYMCCYGVKMK